ncbi:zinc finger CCCH domain-containing protein 3 isoform X2 [Stigmatopora nigra]
MLVKHTLHENHQQRVEQSVGIPVTKPSSSPQSCLSGKTSHPSSVMVIGQFGHRTSQNQPFLRSKTSNTVTQLTDSTKKIVQSTSAAPQTSPFKFSNEGLKDQLQSRQAMGRVMLQNKSKFTWLKNEALEVVKPRPSGSISLLTNVNSRVGSKDGAISFSSPATKRTPAKKSRKLSSINTGARASKYKWVSSSAVVQAKTFRKLSPKALPKDENNLEKEDANKKVKTCPFISPKLKRGFATSTARSSLSRYRWKVGSPRSSIAGVVVPVHRSTFVWTSEINDKGTKKGLACSTLLQPYSSQSAPNSFKLRSRMTIIRKSPNSPNGTTSMKGGQTILVKHSPRGCLLNRATMGARNTPTKELVSFGRHKLRRLSPTSSQNSPAFSFYRTTPLQRMCTPQYKMISHPGFGAAYTSPSCPTLSWRAKKIRSARSFLQNRQRSSLHRYSETSQLWKQSGICWIRGHLYQVSANKLSRTVCHNMSIHRTGSNFFQVNSATCHPYSPRHFASRAVQRSIAVIRQARQKKQRQYCMYYNRFGKCNRGSSCTYIHDPDKVAVCTRFLRGTCKQSDGACPFSHKVDKEKMPVCSYFLKGICNNSNCPYSHVYVSHKAKVCEDFIKGYCPEGEKCKKKHTLVCPDFSKNGSCLLGPRCKLQHHQRAKQSTPTHVSTTSNEPYKRPSLSVVIPHHPQETTGTPVKSALQLPSFISLSSSSEEADSGDSLHPKTTTERNLQIKPRL